MCRNSWAGVVKKDLLKSLQKKVLIAGDGKVLSRIDESESSRQDRVIFYLVNSNWFDDVQIETVKHFMFFSKAKVYCNEKVSIGARHATGLVQIYLDKTASLVECRWFVIYPVHAVLLNFCSKLRQELFNTGYPIVRL